MKIYKKGFITLFFVLGISSMLLTWVIISSTSVFEYLDSKKRFDSYYMSALQDTTCADTFIDYTLRGYMSSGFYRQLFYGDTVFCEITDVERHDFTQDIWSLKFNSGQISPYIRVKNGLIESL